MTKRVKVEKRVFDKALSRLLQAKPISRYRLKAGRKKTATIIGPKD